MDVRATVVPSLLISCICCQLWCAQALAQGLPGVPTALGTRPSDAQLKAQEDELKPVCDLEDRARKLLDAGDYRAAEQVLEKERQLASSLPHGTPMIPGVNALLGRTYMAEARYLKALGIFPLAKPLSQTCVELETSIAYCRLGDYRGALHWYRTSLPQSDSYLGNMNVLPQDLPGTDDLRSLEATALFHDSAVSDSMGLHEFALAELQDAYKLAPFCPFVEYLLADSFAKRARRLQLDPAASLNACHEALRLAQSAASSARGDLAMTAKGLVSMVKSIIYYWDQVTSQASKKPGN